jgi:hypothetical protein
MFYFKEWIEDYMEQLKMMRMKPFIKAMWIVFISLIWRQGH